MNVRAGVIMRIAAILATTSTWTLADTGRRTFSSSISSRFASAFVPSLSSSSSYTSSSPLLSSNPSFPLPSSTGASGSAVAVAGKSGTMSGRHASRVALMSTASGGGAAPDITHVGKSEMNEILEDYEVGGREESQYCVIDVRGYDEVMSTGKLSPSVHTLPVNVIMERNAFEMDPDDFQDEFGFDKPQPDETLVFTCAAGIRSVYACQFAARAGYTNLVNYAGGANEWFRP